MQLLRRQPCEKCRKQSQNALCGDRASHPGWRLGAPFEAAGGEPDQNRPCSKQEDVCNSIKKLAVARCGQQAGQVPEQQQSRRQRESRIGLNGIQLTSTRIPPRNHAVSL